MRPLDDYGQSPDDPEALADHLSALAAEVLGDYDLPLADWGQ